MVMAAHHDVALLFIVHIGWLVIKYSLPPTIAVAPWHGPKINNDFMSHLNLFDFFLQKKC